MKPLIIILKIRIKNGIKINDSLEAIAILENIGNASAPVISKCIASAVANAENNLNLSREDLFVAECYATAGPTLKRMMPRAKGSGNLILKRTSHITVVLDER